MRSTGISTGVMLVLLSLFNLKNTWDSYIKGKSKDSGGGVGTFTLSKGGRGCTILTRCLLRELAVTTSFSAMPKSTHFSNCLSSF